MELGVPQKPSLYVLTEGQRRMLSPPPTRNGGFSEVTEAIFLGPPDTECQLLIDDALIPSVDHVGRRVWSWQPGFYAGEVRAELVSPEGEALGSWQLDVSPDSRKIGKDVFLEMLADILDFQPELAVGQEPARQRLGALGAGQDPIVALARLRARQNALAVLLRQFCSEPRRAVRSRRQLVPLHRVRRADRQTAMAAIRQPPLLAAMGRLDELALSRQTGQLLADVPDYERHHDSPANRCILAMIMALQRRCRDLHEVLEEKVGSEVVSDTVTSLARRWQTWRRILTNLRQDLATTVRRPPFSEVTRAEITSGGLNAVSAHPLYARFWRLASEALRTGVDGLEREELLPLSPTWEIYERWCFVALGQRLFQMFPDFQWVKSSSGSMCGKSRNGVNLRLDLQPNFWNSSGETKSTFWSISRNRIPDIVFSWHAPSRSGFLVLDAKYRVTRENVLDAMSSAHIYQDSLRMGEQRPLASVLLVPAGGGAPWLERPAFVEQNRVGVAAFRPGTEPPHWLTALLRSAMPDEIVQ